MRSPTLLKYETNDVYCLKYTFKLKNVVGFWGTSFAIPPTGFVPRPLYRSFARGPHGDFGDFCGVQKILKLYSTLNTRGLGKICNFD